MPAGTYLELDGEKLTRCPKRPLLDEPELYADTFWYYQLYKEGHLPESTSLGFLGQSNVFVQSCRVIDAAMADLREEKKERQRRIEAAKARANAEAQRAQRGT